MDTEEERGETTQGDLREGMAGLAPLGDLMTGQGPHPTERKLALALGTNLAVQATGPRALGKERSGLFTQPRTSVAVTRTGNRNFPAYLQFFRE